MSNSRELVQCPHRSYYVPFASEDKPIRSEAATPTVRTAAMPGTETSKTPREQGLLSAYMCLKAKESAENHTFVKL